MQSRILQTPLRPVRIDGDWQAIRRIRFLDRRETQVDSNEDEPDSPWLRDAVEQLREYFAGQRVDFSLPLAWDLGTAFQRSVWDQLANIPFGQTLSYGQLARRIGKPKAARAVGLANHHNPFPIVVPCHRVIETNGKLGGYGGGIEIKQRLLDHEQAVEPSLHEPLSRGSDTRAPLKMTQ